MVGKTTGVRVTITEILNLRKAVRTMALQVVLDVGCLVISYAVFVIVS